MANLTELASKFNVCAFDCKLSDKQIKAIHYWETLTSRGVSEKVLEDISAKVHSMCMRTDDLLYFLYYSVEWEYMRCKHEHLELEVDIFVKNAFDAWLTQYDSLMVIGKASISTLADELNNLDQSEETKESMPLTLDHIKIMGYSLGVSVY